ncbi:MAG: heme o synthase [Chlamydiota bacterium]|nr:heme o synthase [Chlamydiota bacterium]
MNTIVLTRRRAAIGTYLELLKPRRTLMVVLTAVVGALLASGEGLDMRIFAHLILGVFFAAGGANALNQYLERDADAQMKRTRRRPLPSGRMLSEQALLFSIGVTLMGVLQLTYFINLLTGLLGMIAVITYVFLYTPLKSRTSNCILIGAVSGAIPPMIGWAAFRAELSVGGWILFMILFLWQMPHFLSLLFLLRDDYRRAGYPMHRLTHHGGSFARKMIVVYLVLLILASILPVIYRLSGPIYCFGTIVMDLCFLGLGIAALLSHTAKVLAYAKRLFNFSILYLMIIMILLVLDKI